MKRKTVHEKKADGDEKQNVLIKSYNYGSIPCHRRASTPLYKPKLMNPDRTELNMEIGEGNNMWCTAITRDLLRPGA